MRAAWFFALTCVGLLLFSSGTARAHVIGLSRGEYSSTGAAVHATITMRNEDAALLGPGLDAADVIVEADHERCTGTLEDTAPDAPDGRRVRMAYVCSHVPSHLHMELAFLERLPAGHRHLATVHLPAGDVTTLGVLARPTVDVDVQGPASVGFVSLLRGGVEHILTGADHLAFLLALILGGTLVADRRLRVGSLMAMLTAFTIGHSASLALATLGGVVPGARFVEPAVALSVAYVGAENLLARGVRRRWLLTLPFGFVHGFAFAGGLLLVGTSRAELPVALLGFNLGVELGQLLVLAVALPPLLLLRSRDWFPRGARLLSASIAAAGVLWFVERAFAVVVL